MCVIRKGSSEVKKNKASNLPKRIINAKVVETGIRGWKKRSFEKKQLEKKIVVWHLEIGDQLWGCIRSAHHVASCSYRVRIRPGKRQDKKV